MYILVEVDDFADVGNNEINRWVAEQIDSCMDGDYESICMVAMAIYPVTRGDNHKN